MDISKKVAYLKGYAEGLEIRENSKEGKLLIEILNVLSDVADTLSALEFDMDVVVDELDHIDDELAQLFEEDMEEISHSLLLDDDYDDYEGEIHYVFCPNCEEEVLLDEEMLDEGEISCPACGEHLEFDFDELSPEEIDPD